jgi:hypothetical protein
LVLRGRVPLESFVAAGVQPVQLQERLRSSQTARSNTFSSGMQIE